MSRAIFTNGSYFHLARAAQGDVERLRTNEFNHTNERLSLPARRFILVLKKIAVKEGQAD